MREEIIRRRDSSGDVLGLAGRFYQSADVDEERQIIGIVKSGEFRGSGVHAIRTTRAQRMERTLRESKAACRRAAPPRGIELITSGGVRHDGGVCGLSPAPENANPLPPIIGHYARPQPRHPTRPVRTSTPSAPPPPR